MRIIGTLIVLTVLTAAPLRPQGKQTYGITSVEQSGDLIVITYFHTPVGDEPDAEYDVSVRLTREKDKAFSVRMKESRGDIGDGRFVGPNRRILWAYKKQLPKGLPFDDIEFELTIEKNTGVPAWLYYAGGAAIVAGATAAILLSASDDEPTGGGSGTLPAPPSSRPN